MVVVLPEPFTPTTRITKGWCAAIDHQRLRAGAEDLDMRCAQGGDQGLDVGEFLARHAPAQLIENVLGGLDADIGREQPRLQLLEDCSIDLAAP